MSRKAWAVVLIAAITVFAGGSLFASIASADQPSPARAELNPLQAHAAYVMAHGISGIALPEKAPTVHLTSRETLRTMACGERGNCQAVQGWTQDASAVYVAADLDWSNPADASVLVHEYVHALQYAARGGPARDCHEWREREAQAYAVQMQVLAKCGAPTAAVSLAARQVAAITCA